MTRKKPMSESLVARILANEATNLADYATKALAVIQKAPSDTNPLLPFPLERRERAALAGLTTLSAEVRKSLAGRVARFTVCEVLGIIQAVATSWPAVAPEQQIAVLNAAGLLWYYVHRDVLVPVWRAEASQRKPSRRLYQLKITLAEVEPAIWRRIQIKDCTLDKLHEHIQTAMGWKNSHLHGFELGGQSYADPELMEETFHETNCRDSTITLLSAILPSSGKRLPFRYVYDFGDHWTHDVLFEGCPKPEKGRKYPWCVEGERACPPEDVGGVWGYAEFLETIHDRQAAERIETLEWADGWFDPEEFDAHVATKSMWKGLPDWRTMA